MAHAMHCHCSVFRHLSDVRSSQSTTNIIIFNGNRFTFWLASTILCTFFVFAFAAVDVPYAKQFLSLAFFHEYLLSRGSESELGATHTHWIWANGRARAIHMFSCVHRI